MRRKPKSQTFNDGICVIYSIKNIAQAGEKPKDGLAFKAGPLRYDERTVGMNRFWAAKQADARIDRLIRVPRIESVSTHDVAVLNSAEQYSLEQVQYPPDVDPKCMDLSLERINTKYMIQEPPEEEGDEDD